MNRAVFIFGLQSHRWNSAATQGAVSCLLNSLFLIPCRWAQLRGKVFARCVENISTHRAFENILKHFVVLSKSPCSPSFSFTLGKGCFSSRQTRRCKELRTLNRCCKPLSTRLHKIETQVYLHIYSRYLHEFFQRIVKQIHKQDPASI